MNPGLVVKLRPIGPWRSGPDTGARDQVDHIYHSDSLYGAVCGAMSALGMLEDWLDATARRAEGPAVCFSSCFPFQGEYGFVAPPRTAWPPAQGSKLRGKGARFIPLSLVAPLLNGQLLDEDRWQVDGPSECLVPAGQTGPFRTVVRAGAAVDRLTGALETHSIACIEFRQGAGVWCVVAFADDAAFEKWGAPVRAAFRLLADSGFGGKRSLGWGRCADPEFIDGVLPAMVYEKPAPTEENPENGVATAPPEMGPPAYWLLSLFSPSADDSVDWSRGDYEVVTRGGRVDRSGAEKKMLDMIAEGSVLVAPEAMRGAAPDVAPDGYAHPVYRAGFALAIPVGGPVAGPMGGHAL